jgi:autotransporter-associated beta strand protein
MSLLEHEEANWQWSSLWRLMHGDESSRALAADWPAARPRDWRSRINRPGPAKQLEGLPRCKSRAAHNPYLTVTLAAGGSISNGTLAASLYFEVYSGSISANLVGTGRLDKRGSGTVVLSGDNDYTGGTHLYEGTLQIAGPDSLPPGTWIIIGD